MLQVQLQVCLISQCFNWYQIQILFQSLRKMSDTPKEIKEAGTKKSEDKQIKQQNKQPPQQRKQMPLQVQLDINEQKMGGWQLVQKQSYEGALNFLIQTVPNIKQLKFESAQRQVVNGWKYRFTFRGTRNHKVFFIVHQSLQKKFQLTQQYQQHQPSIKSSVNQGNNLKQKAEKYDQIQRVKGAKNIKQQLGGWQSQSLSLPEQISKFLDKQIPHQILGFKLIKYMKQVVNGWNHKLVYSNSQGSIKCIVIYQNLQKKLELVSATNSLQQIQKSLPGNQSPQKTQTKQTPPPNIIEQLPKQMMKLGGWQNYQISEAKQVQKFLRQRYSQVLKSMNLTQYNRQIVNGWNHKLTFRDNNSEKVIVVYEDFNHKFELVSQQENQSKTKDKSSEKIIPAFQKYIVEESIKQEQLGGWQKTNIEQARQVEKYIKQNQPQKIKQKILVQYYRQVINGWNHRLIYQGKNQETQTITIRQSTQNKFTFI